MALNCRPRVRAFSLLELIIAIVILSSGITVVLQAISFSSRITGLSCEMIKAVLLAEDKMQELDFKEKQGWLNQEPQKLEGKNGKFVWEYTLILDEDLNLYKLDFGLSWKRQRREEGLNLKTYLR